MMTLDEAIAHAKEVAKKNKNLAKTYESFKDYGNPKSSITSGHKRCLECATEHEQLAAWLTELKALRIANPKGEWLYPYADIKIGGRRVGKRDKECSVCHRQFSNNLPWDASFCPFCGADMRGGDVI